MKLSKCFSNLSTPKGVLSILLFAVILVVLFNSVKREGFEGRKELLLLHMEGCSHCAKLMPEWEKFVELNDTPITTRAVEQADDTALVKKYGVKGFPTILLLNEKGDKLDTYKGERTAKGLLDYCRQNSV